ncbi:hypothetical protein DdX_12267 [Ditylenchus destructor]|uniref:Uncharacterized protein n=1 Tax=Ditylenchus destructor TaxID=166010 RepID=A0AAD4R3T6_9BILA|nr:hypothetical protein DdX_12267 [Ditylenchus destructor]
MTAVLLWMCLLSSIQITDCAIRHAKFGYLDRSKEGKHYKVRFGLTVANRKELYALVDRAIDTVCFVYCEPHTYIWRPGGLRVTENEKDGSKKGNFLQAARRMNPLSNITNASKAITASSDASKSKKSFTPQPLSDEQRDIFEKLGQVAKKSWIIWADDSREADEVRPYLKAHVTLLALHKMVWLFASAERQLSDSKKVKVQAEDGTISLNSIRAWLKSGKVDKNIEEALRARNRLRDRMKEIEKNIPYLEKIVYKNSDFLDPLIYVTSENPYRILRHDKLENGGDFVETTFFNNKESWYSSTNIWEFYMKVNKYEQKKGGTLTEEEKSEKRRARKKYNDAMAVSARPKIEFDWVDY